MDTYIYKTREKALVHGISRAGIAKAQGQSARAGFWSGFISSAFATPAEYGMIKGTAITAAVSGTISTITGGKFANGAVTGAFIHLFNTMGQDPIMKKAFGDPREMAENSRNMATWAGRMSAGLAMVKNVYTQMASKVLGGLASIATFNAQLLDIEAGTFEQNSLIVDTMTTFTEYCKNPIGEQIYDEAFGKAASFIFEYGDYKQ